MNMHERGSTERFIPHNSRTPNECARDNLIEADSLLSRCRSLLDRAREPSIESAKLVAEMHLEQARRIERPRFEVYCDEAGRQYILDGGQPMFGTWVPEAAA